MNPCIRPWNHPKHLKNGPLSAPLAADDHFFAEEQCATAVQLPAVPLRRGAEGLVPPVWGFSPNLGGESAQRRGDSRPQPLVADVGMLDVLGMERASYEDTKLDTLFGLLETEPTAASLAAGGMAKVDRSKRFDGPVNYMAIYCLTSKGRCLAMCDAMEKEMGIAPQTVGSFRAKVERHSWDRDRPLRVGMSGECSHLLPPNTPAGCSSPQVSTLLVTVGGQHGDRAKDSISC